ncbi:hypothetical protein CCACVL1_03112 [Corchorus capsularis]|uniref:Uncharacterized protein n=1 Tax=Corchorus capsularis TaxID=210143 RepID=A0A1R3K2N1_COCAP|nr:hypothetical protein CCACVL1_03112 [Corchorus capsularis]
MIKESILSGTYEFSSFVLREDPPKGVENFQIVPSPFPSLPNSYQRFFSNSEDELVLMAMSNVLCLSVRMPIPRYMGDALCLKEEYYFSTGSIDFLIGWGEIFNLIRIDFSQSAISLDSNVVLDSLHSVIFDRKLIDLFTAFCLSSTVVDNEKNPILGWFEGILPAGYISYILLNLVLDSWEKKLKVDYPTIKYYRFTHYAFIGLPYISSMSESTVELRESFSEMSLNGNPTSTIGRSPGYSNKLCFVWFSHVTTSVPIRSIRNGSVKHSTREPGLDSFVWTGNWADNPDVSRLDVSTPASPRASESEYGKTGTGSSATSTA